MNTKPTVWPSKMGREDLFSALADTTPEERESRMKILIGHDTGVFQPDLDEFAKR